MAPPRPSPSSPSSPFHPGERAVQERAGEVAVAERAGGASVSWSSGGRRLRRTRDGGRGARAPGGQVWVTLLTGPEGFAEAADEGTVVVHAVPAEGDSLRPVLAPATPTGAPTPVGVLALDPATRCRMRVNGLATATADGLTIVTTQVFGNCPKYIRPRRVVARRPDGERPGGPPAGTVLTAAQRAWVAAADTFPVGTADVDGSADASHRGGAAGFVHVVGDDRLRIPDYRGNSMYMTLGNLERQPAAGLLFVDWERGSTPPAHRRGEGRPRPREAPRSTPGSARARPDGDAGRRAAGPLAACTPVDDGRPDFTPEPEADRTRDQTLQGACSSN